MHMFMGADLAQYRGALACFEHEMELLVFGLASTERSLNLDLNEFE